MMHLSDHLPGWVKSNVLWVNGVVSIVAVVAVVWTLGGFGAGRNVLVVSAILACLAVLLVQASVVEKQSGELRRLQQVAGSHRPILEGDDLLETATNLLRKSTSRLDYYGGAGFLGANGEAGWKAALTEKIEKGDFQVCRYFDFKSVEEMDAAMREEAIEGKQRFDMLLRYVVWLHSQGEAMSRGIHNHYYATEAAPMWQWGIHAILFDRRDLIVTFNHVNKRVGIIIENAGEGATTMLEALLALSQTVACTPLGAKHMKDAAQKGYEWLLSKYSSEPRCLGELHEVKTRLRLSDPVAPAEV